MLYTYIGKSFNLLKEENLAVYNNIGMMLSEVSQSQKEKYCMIPVGYLIKLIKAESTVVVTRDGQEGKMKNCYSTVLKLQSYKISSREVLYTLVFIVNDIILYT